MGLTEQLGVGRAGAHSAAVGGSAAYGCGVPLAGIVRPPSPVRRVSIERAHGVRPYGGSIGSVRCSMLRRCFV